MRPRKSCARAGKNFITNTFLSLILLFFQELLSDESQLRALTEELQSVMRLRRDLDQKNEEDLLFLAQREAEIQASRKKRDQVRKRRERVRHSKSRGHLVIV